MKEHQILVRLDEEGVRLGRMYGGAIPGGGEVQGLVKRGDGFGAFVRLPNGVFVQVNAGVVRTLPPIMHLTVKGDGGFGKVWEEVGQ